MKRQPKQHLTFTLRITITDKRELARLKDAFKAGPNDQLSSYWLTQSYSFCFRTQEALDVELQGWRSEEDDRHTYTYAVSTQDITRYVK